MFSTIRGRRRELRRVFGSWRGVSRLKRGNSESFNSRRKRHSRNDQPAQCRGGASATTGTNSPVSTWPSGLRPWLLN